MLRDRTEKDFAKQAADLLLCADDTEEAGT
jgi:hypothetical protein